MAMHARPPNDTRSDADTVRRAPARLGSDVPGRRAGTRIAALANLAARIASTATMDDFVAAVTEHAGHVVGAAVAAVAFVDRDGRTVRLRAGSEVDPVLAGRYDWQTLASRTMTGEAARTGAPVFVANRREAQERFPDMVSDGEVLGMHAGVALPGRAVLDDPVTVVVSLGWPHEVEFDDEITATLVSVQALITQAYSRLVLHERVERDRSRAERLSALVVALASVANTVELDETIVARFPELLGAAYVTFGVIDERAECVRIVRRTDTIDPEIRARYVEIPLAAATPIGTAASTGDLVLLHDDEECALRFPRSAADMQAAGLVATASIPVTYRGRVLGAIGVGWNRSAEFDAALEALFRTLGEVCGQTLVRVRSADAAVATAALSAQVAALAQALSAAHSFDELAEAVAELAPPIVNGRRAALRPVERAHHYIHVVGDKTRDVANRSSGSVPVIGSMSRRVATVDLEWDEPVAFDDAMSARLATLSEPLSLSVQRTEATEAEHQLVAALQRRLLRVIAQVDGLAIAARYYPAERDLGMGGDWYDVIALDDDRVACVLGDIAGHGVDAIADMAQAGTTIATLLRAGTPLADVIVATRDALADRAVIATIVVAVVDRSQRTVEYVLAGHPPLLLIDPAGSAVFLADGAQPLLGVEPSGPTTPGSAVLPDDATLVLYSDGLVERRGESIDDGMARLADSALANADRAPEALVDAVVRGCLGTRRPADDVALLVVQTGRA